MAQRQVELGPPSPLEGVNIPSQLTFWWLNGLLWKAWRTKNLTVKDVFELPAIDKCSKSGKDLEDNILAMQKSDSKLDMRKALAKTFWVATVPGAIFMLMWTTLQIFGPYFLLNRLIQFFVSDDPKWHGYLYAAGILVNQALITVFGNQMFFHSAKVGVRCRGAVCAVVYRKAMRVSAVKSVGEVVNLFGNDTQRLIEFFTFVHFLWIAPLQSIAIAVLLYLEMGWSALMGIALMFILFGVQIFVGRASGEVRRKSIQETDKRIRSMNEILSSIKMLKLYAWETAFSESVARIRNVEVSYLRTSSWLKGFANSMTYFSTLVAATIIYITYWAIGKELTASNAFVTLALLNALRAPVIVLPPAVKSLAESLIACERLSKFLSQKEVTVVQHDGANSSPHAVEFDDAKFRWETSDSPEPSLSLSLKIPKKQLTAIAGAVGAGKSTLLSALLGQLPLVAGQMHAHGNVSFAAQQPWILNLTLKENILFGAPLDEERYNHVLDVCCLLPDLVILPAGDRTEIGERGINLSGGQKARVSLARAVYQKADIYLLDDPLSAVDQHVSKRLFQECIRGLLSDSTVILVTHQLQYLSQCDFVVFLDKGQMRGAGTYDALLKSDSEFNALIKTHVGRHSEAQNKPAAKSEAPKEGAGGAADKAKEGDPKKSGTLIMAEDKGAGAVDSRLYASYAGAMGGTLAITFCFLLFFISQVLFSFSSYWLSIWSSRRFDKPQSFFAWIEGVLIGSLVVVAIFRSFYYLSCALHAAKLMHNKIFKRVLEAPLWFFDATPVGRILNRFSKDQDTIDDALPDAIFNTLQNAFTVIGSLLLIVIVLPLFLPILVPISFVYFWLSYFYRWGSRDLKRLEGMTRSPLIAHLTASLQGLPSIRAFGVQDRFIAENEQYVDANNKCFLHFWLVARWLALRLDWISALIAGITAFYCVIAEVNPSIAGLTITQALQIAGILQWTVRSFSEMEAYMTSVERQLYYLRHLPSEPPRVVADHRVDKDWPTQGRIEFRNVTMKYREDLNPVLNNISFVVQPGEKVGIVGRTGAGKSTVSLSLFNMIHRVSGEILIDGVNVFDLGLEDLRSRIAVIPQDPVLFVGTIRRNLDPLGKANDEKLWEALDRVCLKDWVSNQPLKLETMVEDGGENLSVGQRQLLCIARAVLRDSKLLFLDEATAAVDMETDTVIQKTLRNVFQGRTVFAIAHRLNTIIDSDKVLLLDQGQLVEFDHPAALLKNENSAFAKLVRETGKSMTRQLTRMANKSKTGSLLEPIEVIASDGEMKEKSHKEKKAKKEKEKHKVKLVEEQPPGM